MCRGSQERAGMKGGWLTGMGGKWGKAWTKLGQGWLTSQPENSDARASALWYTAETTAPASSTWPRVPSPWEAKGWLRVPRS